ncbi:hypothetical protein EVAR_79692_1 [Eumeta japonica]|uniref:Uncharacterized protein n=1 Tax=Eumeta variegata TaxID=151549 RepID=A0A4C1TCH8_EUMVA|nr:hypothetical protein EVAR_79692_1 [Eumeta japonica]
MSRMNRRLPKYPMSVRNRRRIAAGNGDGTTDTANYADGPDVPFLSACLKSNLGVRSHSAATQQTELMSVITVIDTGELTIGTAANHVPKLFVASSRQRILTPGRKYTRYRVTRSDITRSLGRVRFRGGRRRAALRAAPYYGAPRAPAAANPAEDPRLPSARVARPPPRAPIVLDQYRSRRRL